MKSKRIRIKNKIKVDREKRYKKNKKVNVN